MFKSLDRIVATPEGKQLQFLHYYDSIEYVCYV